MKTGMIVTVLSPHVEKEFYTQPKSEHLLCFLDRIYEIFQNVPAAVVLFIPRDLIGVLSSDIRLRVRLERLRQEKLRIEFPETPKPACCDKVVDPHQRFVDFDYSGGAMRIILALLRSGRRPFVIDHSDRLLTKSVCDREYSEYLCSDTVSFTPPAMSSADRLIKELRTSVPALFKFAQRSDERVGKDLFQYYMIVLVFLHGLPVSAYDVVNQIETHNGFFRDLVGASHEDLVSIAGSMIRSAALPPSTPSPKRKPHSIDWHPHKLASGKTKWEGYRLFRVDVMPFMKSGKTNSGVKRIIMARDERRIVFVGYTDNHDYDDKELKRRISELDGT